MRERIKILFVTTGLKTGGAETMLLNLLSRINRDEFSPTVISLTDEGSIGERIRNVGIPVVALDIEDTRSLVSGVRRLVQHLRHVRPHIVQTWMYHADLIGSLARVGARRHALVWGIRQTNFDPANSKRTTMWASRMCALLSYVAPTGIVCCSNASVTVHKRLGYDSRKMIVIPNGFDLERFQPSDALRRDMRLELGLSDDDVVIGLFGRFDPQKDHRTFVHAASLLASRFSRAQFVLCGERVDWDNIELSRWITNAGVQGRFSLLGLRSDVPRLTAGLDLAVSSSAFGEGFSNVLGEAMACGVCCVTTDVGDGREIVGDTGWTVPAGDPQALSDAWVDAIEGGLEGRQERGRAARLRIKQRYSLDHIVDRYEQYYRSLSMPCAA